MKKIVLILLLASFSFVKANTIIKQKQDFVKNATMDAIEKYDIGGSTHWHCTTTSTSTYHQNPDGSIDIIVVERIHCTPEQTQ